MPPSLFSQEFNIGAPSIDYFSKQTYKAGLANGDGLQDESGIVYFANNDGLLFYNGVEWSLKPLPKRSILRKIELDVDGRIYAGGQNEIGYFYPNEIGDLTFHSLLEKLPEAHRVFDDIWEIVILDNHIIRIETSRKRNNRHEGTKFNHFPHSN